MGDDTRPGWARARATARSEGDRTGKAFSSGLSGGLSSVESATAGAAAGLARMGVGAAILGWAPGAASALLSVAGAAAALPAVLGAAAASASVLGFALSGLGDAISAGLSGGGGGGGGGGAGDQAAQLARQVRDATDQINDSKENLRRVARDTARDVASAEKALASAEEESSRRISDAKREQVRANRDAQRQIADAQEREAESLAALDDARERAGEQLDDLREKVEGYGLSEEGAQLRLQKALAAQRKANRDVTSTNLERADAAYDVRVAEAALAKMQRDRAKDTADLAEQEAKGVEGSDLVVDAKKRAADAAQATADAEEAASERRQDAARAVADAEREGADSVAEARERLALAEESAAERQRDARDAVADAEQRLQDVYDSSAASAGAAAGGVDKYAQALAKLSPEARQLVEAIVSLKDEWTDMANSIQDRALDGLAEKVLELASVYIPLLKDGLGGVADGMNAMAKYAADALMAPETVEAVNALLENTALATEEGATALGDLIAGFLQVAGIGSEYLPAIAGWVADIAARFREWAESAEGAQQIREWIEGAGEALGSLWEIGQNVYDILSGIFTGLAGEDGGGGDFLQMVTDMTQSLSDFVNSDGVQGILGFLGEMARLVMENLPLVAGLWAGFQLLSGMVTLAQGALALYNGIMGAARVAAMAWSVAQWLVNAALSANPIGIVVVAIAALVAAIIYAWNNSETFRNVVMSVWEGIKSAFWGGVAAGRAALDAVVAAMRWCGDQIQAALDWLGGAWDGMWGAISRGGRTALNGMISLINNAIQGLNVMIGGFNSISPVAVPMVPYIPYLAKGGIAGGLAVVGENGPELVNLPQGSTVYPSGQSQGMAERAAERNGGRGGGQFELVAGRGANGAVATMIMSLIRSGDLQLREVS